MSGSNSPQPSDDHSFILSWPLVSVYIRIACGLRHLPALQSASHHVSHVFRDRTRVISTLLACHKQLPHSPPPPPPPPPLTGRVPSRWRCPRGRSRTLAPLIASLLLLCLPRGMILQYGALLVVSLKTSRTSNVPQDTPARLISLSLSNNTRSRLSLPCSP